MTVQNVIAYLFSCHGRCTRLQWWIGQLILLLPYFVLCGVVEDDLATTQAKIIGWIFLVPFVWIDLAVSAKRYHDLDKSGWRQLLMLAPLIGNLWVLIELGFFRGIDYPNRFGYPGVFGRRRR